MTKSITAAICTFNRYDLLGAAIESCQRQSLPLDDYEIIVVDNSPDPVLREETARKYQDTENVIFLEEPVPGLSNARNTALAHSSGRYIAFLDDDAIADTVWLAEVKAGFEAFKSVGVVGGRIDPIWEIPRPGWLPKELEGMFTIIDWGGETRIATPEEWFAGANIAFSVEALKRIGGFNTSLGRNGASSSLLSNEESSVSTAIVDAGFKRVYAPHAGVRHLVAKSRLSRSWMRKRQSWQAVSDFIAGESGVIREQKDYWWSVCDFFSQVPPRYRNYTGLFRDFDDPEMMRRQLGAIYSFTMLQLMGASNPDDYNYDV